MRDRSSGPSWSREPASRASHKRSPSGLAVASKQCSASGDSTHACRSDVPHTVSRKIAAQSPCLPHKAPPGVPVTISHMLSSRSVARQEARWRGPAPAITCSPHSSAVQTASGSLWLSLRSAFTSWGSSPGLAGRTVTRTTGCTQRGPAMTTCTPGSLMVPAFRMSRSGPRMATMLPQGTTNSSGSNAAASPSISAILSTPRLCCTWSGMPPPADSEPMELRGSPKLRTFTRLPFCRVPLKTRPRA
mmetsp:Transcript_16335/g.57062  ORF Transcript_16335/g.57062 Transcript_16335/m.57062 type:complete len:246 (-) Transcript_16335:2415-3152(-)